MPNMLTSLGSFLTSNSGALKNLLGIAGTGMNVYSGVQNAINTSNYNDTQSYIRSLINNPTKMAAAAQKFQQPLSAGLTDAVTNQAEASLAERGLGSSPAASQAVIAQALAPYIQQNQNTAMQTLMSSLGMGSSTQAATLPTVDLSKLLTQLKLGNGAQPADTSGMYQNEASLFGGDGTNAPLSLDNTWSPPTDLSLDYQG